MASQRESIRDWMLELLEGIGPSPEKLNSLCLERVPEGLCLEYKSHLELEEQKNSALSKKGKNTLREYVSAFANSEGGILIVGIDEEGSRAGSVSGIKTYSDSVQLADDIDRSLTPLHPYLLPKHRTYVVEHEKGLVAVIVTPRSHGLVPFPNAGRMEYHFRHGANTLAADSYLIQDLVLGRRNHPRVRLLEEPNDVSVSQSPIRRRSETYASQVDLQGHFNINNDSMLWMEDTWAGFVGFGVVQPSGGPRKPPPFLLPQINIDQHELYNSDSVQLLHQMSQVATVLQPFSEARISLPNFRLPTPRWHHLTVWQSAAYVLSRNHPPTWFQLTVAQITIDSNRSYGSQYLVNTAMHVDDEVTERPTVSFREYAQSSDIEDEALRQWVEEHSVLPR